MTTAKTHKSSMKMSDDKYFFASYLNMARHNVYLNIVDICKRLGKNAPTNDDQIFSPSVFDTLKDVKKPDLALKAQLLLREKFPFIKALMPAFLWNKYEEERNISSASAEDYYELFKLIFAQLNTLRNEYTHEYKSLSPFNRSFLHQLKKVYDASVYKTKEQFMFSEADTKHLIRKGKNGEPKYFKYAFEQDKKITEKGLAFFICLFLEKKYAYLFLKQLEGFKEGQNNAARATLETYCAYSIKLPRFKIESSSQDSLLYMDMINELKRCPSELYEHLDKKEQARFKIKIEDDVIEKGDNSLDPEATLKRYDDRFVYFAMRFLDETKAFDKLRFAMDLGNYIFNVYDKEIDGEMRIRRLNKKLTGYGRFQDYSLDKLYETYGDLVKPSHEIEEDYKEKYIVETYPHYHFDEDNIGIKIINKPEQHRLFPNLEHCTVKGSPKTEAPDVWMSQYELMSFVLYSVLNRKKDNENGVEIDRSTAAQTIVIQHYERIKRFFKDIKDGKDMPFFSNKEDADVWLSKEYKGLKISQIPKELSRFLLQKPEPNLAKLAEDKLLSMIEDTEKRKKRLDKDLDTSERKNKIGRSEHREVKAGVLADFIAEDLMRFQATIKDSEGKPKGKATGLTFQVLQAKIAYYGANKAELKNIFAECNLIDAPNEHPFLQRTKYDKHEGIISFYKTYLEKRIGFLKGCLREKQYDTYFWLHINKAKKRSESDFIKTIAENYYNMPVYFPRGLFIEPIKKYLLENAKSEAFKTLIENSDRVNTVFLLQQYFELELQDGSQDFYAAKRNYEIFDKYFDKREAFDRKPMASKFFSPEEFKQHLEVVNKWIIKDKEQKTVAGEVKTLTFKEKSLIAFEKNEKHIRHEKAKDMVLLLLIKDLMLKSSDKDLWQQNIENVKLKEIAPDSEQGILAMQRPFSLEQFFTEDINGKPNKDNTIKKYITQDALKIKNFGDFRRFVKDRRLSNLMFFIEKETILRKELEDELEAYDTVRIEIFKAIAEFEKKAYLRYKNNIRHEDRNNEHKRILELFFQDFPKFKTVEAQILSIRNAFSHNQYPSKSYWQTGIGNDFPIAINLKNFAVKHYKSFTNVL
jgi:hypothetical protein